MNLGDFMTALDEIAQILYTGELDCLEKLV